MDEILKWLELECLNESMATNSYQHYFFNPVENTLVWGDTYKRIEIIPNYEEHDFSVYLIAHSSNIKDRDKPALKTISAMKTYMQSRYYFEEIKERHDKFKDSKASKIIRLENFNVEPKGDLDSLLCKLEKAYKFSQSEIVKQSNLDDSTN